MLVQVLTLFPEMFSGVLGASILKRAQARGLLRVEVIDLRPFGIGRHHQCDDYPFGGGPGMVLRVDVVVPAVEWALAQDPAQATLLWTSPQGRRLDQQWCRELALRPRLIIVAGHYEGIDQRAFDLLGGEEVSIGDYVLTGGELPAMVILDAVARLIPGVLGDAASAAHDSFGPECPWLEGPQYTRPVEYRGLRVPEVLLSGHHARIAAWRREAGWQRTVERRPDLAARCTARGLTAEAGTSGGREGRSKDDGSDSPD
ncbi:MAG: tRNA (guanosine(37)-N1)-methyltransferase TrmD [Firmicutes bacterium]|nr:tRNA (guanosine(37)-N1)-methyltransferase TrmD [Alicyclobacillaceae bacterium]MCL6496363.1 tRNA (guanosine(37)-N1)-methyltransferase TrmD [Bacillota bacterium]